jgi:hypothetical protein
MTGEQAHGVAICGVIAGVAVGVVLLGCALVAICAALVGGHDTFDPDTEAAIVEALDTVAPVPDQLAARRSKRLRAEPVLMAAPVVDGLTLRTYVAVVHVTVPVARFDTGGEEAAADLLTAGVTDPGEDVQIISLTEVSQ